jgi:hypothetical protein
MDKLLSIEETQAKIPVKMSTLRYWIASKRLPIVRCGRRVFVKKSVVEQIVDKGLDSATLNGNV